MGSVDVGLMVTKATSYWRKADINALKVMQEVSKEEPMAILNQAELFALEDIINHIPEKRRRSIIRKIKRAVTYPFKLKVRIKVN
jgi:hypothetical protein